MTIQSSSASSAPFGQGEHKSNDSVQKLEPIAAVNPTVPPTAPKPDVEEDGPNVMEDERTTLLKMHNR